MKKSYVFAFFMGVFALGAPVRATAEEFSLIVAPARYNVIQVLFDVIDRNPAVLVSYQGEATTENPALHVWNGSTWNAIGVHELQELGFLQRTPSRAILVGDDALLPNAVRESVAWLPEVVYVRELSNSAMLNEFGRIFNWSGRDYRWFARRYNLDIEDEAAPARQSSWYDQAGPRPKNRSSSGAYTPAPATEPAPAEVFPAAEPVTVDLAPAEPVVRAQDMAAPAVENVPAPAPAPAPAPVIEERAPVTPNVVDASAKPSAPSKPSNLDEFIKTLEAERAKSSEPFPIK